MKNICLFLRLPSIKSGNFVDGNLFLRSASRKKAVFLDGNVFSWSSSKIGGIFLDGKWQTKRDTLERMSLLLFGNEMPDQVGHDVIMSGITYSSLPAWLCRHCRFDRPSLTYSAQ